MATDIQDKAFASELVAWRDDVRRRATRRLARAPARVPRAWSASLLALAVLLHVLLFIALRHSIRKAPRADAAPVFVRLISETEPSLPKPPEASRPRLPMRLRPAPLTPSAPAATSSEAEPSAAPPHIFMPDGRIDLPAASSPAVPSIAFIPRSTAPSALFNPQRALKVRPNYFDKMWRAPVHNDTLLVSIDNFVEDHLTVTKEFRTPWGTKIKCEVKYLGMVVGACAWGFPPEWGRPVEPWKPASVLDER